jgi:hypothetical protein
VKHKSVFSYGLMSIALRPRGKYLLWSLSIAAPAKRVLRENLNKQPSGAKAQDSSSPRFSGRL